VNIRIKSAADLEKMRRSGRAAAQVLDFIGAHVQAGVSTNELDQLCHRFIVDELGAIPANVGYRGFPKTICTSVNHVVCHGIPSDKVLKDGDIINIDVAVILDGFYGDTSRMYTVGTPSILARRLIHTAFEAMWAGIRTVRPGVSFRQVARAVQQRAEADRFSVVREYCGHGVGRDYHEDPQVLHFDDPRADYQDIILRPGMTFTIEPMINAGRREVKLLPDKWTVITKDRSLSAQWEHMVAVTESGHEVLTLSPAQAALAAA
jgi:methionyl aminopeptidase